MNIALAITFDYIPFRAVEAKRISGVLVYFEQSYVRVTCALKSESLATGASAQLKYG
jgi:hypothetical protein